MLSDPLKEEIELTDRCYFDSRAKECSIVDLALEFNHYFIIKELLRNGLDPNYISACHGNKHIFKYASEKNLREIKMELLKHKGMDPTVGFVDE